MRHLSTRLGEQRGYGTEYRTVYFQLNLDHPKFYEMAETSMEDDEEIWKEVVNSHTERSEKNFTLDELKCYQKNMREKYQNKIVLSTDVQNYLTEMTEGTETVIQKLRAIEKELSSYTYTKSPGKLPDTITNQEDFLDYFLLESQKGYCSYFATAFVLMARGEGIPARYVEGFCVPVTKNKKMTVTANMAHAWPEVYIEGVGWLPFEPTPGYEDLRYTPWKMKAKKDTGNQIMVEEEEPEEIPTEEIVLENQEIDQKDNRLMFIIFSGFFAACFVCLFVLFLEQMLFKRRYLRMSIEKQFLVEVRRNLWLLARMGYARKEEETLEELEERVKTSLPELFQDEQGFVFIQGYEEYLYREKVVQEKTLETTISEQKLMLLWMKSSRRWYYFTVILRMKFVR